MSMTQRRPGSVVLLCSLVVALTAMSALIEPLVAGAAQGSVATFIDFNGDQVKFAASNGDLTSHITASTLAPDNLHYVFTVDLSDPTFDFTDFSVSVTKVKGADGQVIVGHIDAGTNVLGTVNIAGDLGEIDAGLAPVLEIKSLIVNSFGRFGQHGNGDSFSLVTGNVGSLVVKHDFIGVNFYVNGNLLSASIGGSVIGGNTGGDGQIYAAGSVGKVTIKHDIRGGDGAYSGAIGAGFDVASVTIGGSIYGGKGDNSGDIFAANVANGTIGKVTVGGSVIGGDGEFSGVIGGGPAGGVGHNVSLGTVLIGKDIVGGSGLFGGEIWAYGGSLDRLTLKGSLIGGTNSDTGLIAANTLNADGHGATIAILGSVYGGAGTDSADIEGDKGIDALTIGGSFIGGSGSTSAEIFVPNGTLGVLTIHGDVRGGSETYSGSVYAPGGITTKLIGGAVIPGTGPHSGTVTD
jgi:hypothetical protein